MKSVLILVDIQNDFLPGGALPVPDGDKIIPIVNLIKTQFQHAVATQDWHPADHHSFETQHPGRAPGDIIELNGLKQVIWPVHCVQHTHGAAFAPGLDTRRVERIFYKGTDPEMDSYSGFFDNGHRHATGLNNYLNEHKLTNVYIVGLATDYCVKATAIDAALLGFKTHVIADACRGVNLKPGDDARAFEAMRQAGVDIVMSDQLKV